MDMYHYGHSWGLGGGMWFLTILFWILVILGIVYILRQVRSSNSNTSSPPESPRSILDARFARGEIDEETYKRMKEHLKSSG